VAAAEVFAERGLDATLDEIAHHAGLGVGTVYRRFPGKEELIEALFEQAVQEVALLAEQAEAMEDSWEGLAWFLERATEMQSRDLGLRDVILYSGHGRERVAMARESIVPVVTRLVERAQHDGHLRKDFVATDVPVIELMLSSGGGVHELVGAGAVAALPGHRPRRVGGAALRLEDPAGRPSHA